MAPHGKPQDNKVVIVTGGTYGIGRAITLLLAEKGYAVVAFGLDQAQIGSLAANGTDGTNAELAALGLEADLLQADVSRQADVDRVVDFTLAKYGRVDGLVNNAAIHPHGTILETTADTWDQVIDVNLKGMFLMVKAVLPHMIEAGGGAVVNVSSGSAFGRANLLAYSASKGGVMGFSYALAYDHYRDHVRVNIVIPGGGLITGMTEGYVREGADGSSATVAGRRATGRDVAAAVEYFLSDSSEVISGSVIDVGRFANQGGPVAAPRPLGVAGAV